MKLYVFALTMTIGIVWGGALLLVGLLNLAYADYGNAFLEMMASVYPGFDNSHNVGDVLAGTAYAFVDGAICGLLIAVLYNLMARRSPRTV